MFRVILLIFFATQLYWAWQAYVLAKRLIPRTRTRLLAGGAVLGIYLVLMAYCFGLIGKHVTPVHLTVGEAFLSAPFWWWGTSSFFAFLVAMAVRGAGILVRPRNAKRTEPAEPSRRQFLERTAAAVTAAPFVAGGYGLFYGRLNLETTHQRIVLPLLPKSFEGFRIAQLSDIHIGPFMTEEEIRKYAAIANSLKPHLTVLTGDFVTWDAVTQEPLVASLSGLRAPFGVFGCLGNHDMWARIEDSITALFARADIRILRHEAVPIRTHGESLNLIGVDFQTPRPFGPSQPPRRLLGGVENLMAPGQVNILLSHNPDTFPRAAELGIDLSLAGHTHGGQLALEFISPEIAPSRLVTPYVAGLFQKGAGQLYVNRGIGTIGPPMRVGASPEITVYELVRG